MAANIAASFAFPAITLAAAVYFDALNVVLTATPTLSSNCRSNCYCICATRPCSFTAISFTATYKSTLGGNAPVNKLNSLPLT